MRATVEDYRQLLTEEQPQGLRPPGPAQAGDPALLAGFAPELTRMHNRFLDLLSEQDPTTTFEMLGDQEAWWELPDPCAQGVATTMQERRAALVDKRTSRGGATVEYLGGVAERLGYDVTITEWRPFRFGMSRFGEAPFNGPHGIRRLLTVTVHGPRVTLFRFGESAFGEPLGKVTQAEDLECRLRKIAHTHLDIRFIYEGA